MSKMSVGAFVLVAGLLGSAQPAQAGVFRGIQAVLAGILEVPISTLAGTFNGPLVLGTALGAVSGVINGAGLVASGVLELAASAVPIAKTLAPLIPLFM